MNGLKEKLFQALGVIPERPAPSPAVLIEDDFPLFKRQVVEYQTGDGEKVRAFLFLPKQREAGSCPAAIALHPHLFRYDLGKSEAAGYIGNPDYAYGLELAERGYAVICPDFLCFEARRSGLFVLPEYSRNSDDEKNRASYLLAAGSSYGAKCIGDMQAALDVLLLCEPVDPERVCAVGHEMGGQEAIWLMWADERIKAAVCSCGFAKVAHLMENMADVNMAMIVNGMLRCGDYDDILAAVAPKPVFFSYPRDDGNMPMKSYEDISRKAAEAYAGKNALGHLCLETFAGAMDFPEEMRRKAYRFLQKVL